MTGNRYGDAPLGKSVEEVEQDSSNRVNSPVEGEQLQDEAGALPAIVNGNASSVPAIVNPRGLMEDGSGADDGTARSGQDSSEGTA
ncbi:hypothetical protein [Deinococcus budaensis]|uniref:Uncharacterized protein n=1 Tax=Deinococcus budaensis TaxID=1665626 RepID=A0A7W8GBX6_9DEIO|nr:hypothetical protein [Deinococcus budaensis]MBB5232677.1 hypothetical protein [Deinococcus budaensis]